ncbi:TM2 domain-containing protein [Pasteurellaceae bacterium TAE3-ERU1]|nr:TM2 domain-containing protein [Pasteurellaceae bacterium TAE3-ERU1]
MDSRQFADSYVMTNTSNFPSDKIVLLKEKLSTMPEDKQALVQSAPLKNPMVVLLLSLFFGALGIDRFYLGDVGLGIFKFLSIFVFIGLLWALVDIFLCYKKAKEINFNKVMQLI